MTMQSVTSLLPFVTTLVPIVGGVAAMAAGYWKRNAGIAVVAGAALLTLVLSLYLMVEVRDGPARELTLVPFIPPIWIVFRVDPLGALFAATVALLYLLALVYAFGYLPDDERQWWFHLPAMVCEGCLIGVAFAGNLVTLLVFYEVFSLLTYPLIVFDRTREAIAAGLKYIVYIISGSAVILAGVLLVFHLGGGTRFVPGGLPEMPGGHAILVTTFVCLVAGFGIKAALMPLHGWVPDVHPAAPSPFSAILSGVMVATGAFAILRVLFGIFGPARLELIGVLPWLAVVAGATVLLAAGRAVAEDGLKRRLAWSTISQVAYVSLAASALGPAALVGGLVHIVHHAFMKGGLFFGAGLIRRTTGLTRVSQLRGLSRRMPLTAGALTLLALGMVGVPPLSGFVGKWVLGLGLVEAGAMVELVVILAGALLAAAYLWPVVYRIWLPPADDESQPPSAGEGSPWMLGPLLAAGVITVILGVAAALPGFPIDLARAAVAGLVVGAP